MHSDYSKRVQEGLKPKSVEHDHEIINIPGRDPVLKMPKVLLSLSPGDLVLWDSRTIHSGRP